MRNCLPRSHSSLKKSRLERKDYHYFLVVQSLSSVHPPEKNDRKRYDVLLIDEGAHKEQKSPTYSSVFVCALCMFSRDSKSEII